MAGPKPPPEGVSGITEMGGRQQIPTTPKRTGKSRRRKPGEDVLENVNRGKKVASTAGPPGTGRISRDIVEMPMAATQTPQRHTASFPSIDGETYTFRTHDTKGKPIKSREVFCMFLAMREDRLGGDPFVVFDAFKLTIEDVNGKQFYPVQGLKVPDSAFEPAGEDEEDPEVFSLAGD